MLDVTLPICSVLFRGYYYSLAFRAPSVYLKSFFFQVKIKVVEVTVYENCVVEFSNTCWACMETIWLCIVGNFV